MFGRTAAVAVAALLLGGALGFAEPAAASPATDARAIRAGLAKAVRADRLPADKAAKYRGSVVRARGAIGRLPASRSVPLARVLWLVRRQAGAFNAPRAAALFGMLEQNTRYLSRRGLPAEGTDVMGYDGVVYRAGWGYGLQFHPLANVIKLNSLLYQGKRNSALRLARALGKRLVWRPKGAVWEYYFPYGGGSPPWTSGMAQAIGVQSLARTARRLGAPKFFTPARRAYLAIPPRLVGLPAGPWVRLYSFSGMLVLNAQLQTALSIADYGRITEYAPATRLGERLEASSRALLGRYDTGAWTTYVPGVANETSLKYHLYHVELAMWLSRRTRSEFWQAAHGRFDRYSHEPAKFRSGPWVPTLYPRPSDGFRDSTVVRVWVSKVSRVTLRVGGSTFYLGQRRRGWHAVTWRPGPKRPGLYRPRVTATDLAGNVGSARLRAIRIARDTTPPDVTASVSGARLTWKIDDPTTPWVRLRVQLLRQGKLRVLELGRRPLAGRVRLALPRGRFQATLVAFDSSGNRTRTPLGQVPVPPS